MEVTRFGNGVSILYIMNAWSSTFSASMDESAVGIHIYNPGTWEYYSNCMIPVKALLCAVVFFFLCYRS